jgi:PKD repeat protein
MLGVELDGAAKFQIMVDTTSIPYFGNKYVGSGILNAKNALDAVEPPCEVAADFSADQTTGCSTLAVAFSDLSVGPVVSWDWDFGDGQTSTAQNPSHTYNAPGVYTVTLVASSITCSDAEVKTDFISVGSTPAAAFSAAPTAGYAPLTVSFTDESAGNPTSWSWDFGDGGSSTAQSPSHTYEAAGTYTVRLTAQNACGADIAESIGLITVEEPPASTEALALSDIPVKGVVTGDYRNTHAFDLDYEFLTEVLSGGRPSNRYSVLDHRWEFNIAGGETITFSAAAFSTEGLDGDDFQFEYSTDDSNYEYLMDVSKTDIGVRTAPLPGYLSGRVYIRVVDTGHSPGDQTLDSVFVDYLSIASEGTAPPPSGSMYVESTSVVRIPGRGGRYQAEAEVVVVEGNGTPLSGATVEGSFSGPTSESVSGVTGADGSVVFRSKKVKNPSGGWCFGVTQVTYPGLTYDSETGVPSACE